MKDITESRQDDDEEEEDEDVDIEDDENDNDEIIKLTYSLYTEINYT